MVESQPKSDRVTTPSVSPQSHEIGRSLVENTILVVGCRITTAASALVLIPIIVSKLGVRGYGSWEALLAVSSLALMFQGSIGATTIWRASTAYGAKNLDDIDRAARIGIFATIALFLIIIPPVWMVREPLVGLLNIDKAFRPAASVILPTLVGIMILGGATESVAAIITAHQRTGLTNISNAAALLCNYVVVIVGLQYGCGLWSVLLGYATNYVVNTAIICFTALRVSGKLCILPAIPTMIELRSMGSYYGLVFVGFMSASLRDHTDKIILASLASPAWVAYYAIASRLAGLALEVGRFFYVPALAAFAALNAVGDWASIRSLFSRLMTGGAMATGAVVVVVAGLHDRLLVLWMGESVAPATPMLLVLLAGNAVAVMLTGPGTSLCRAVGKVVIETSYVVINLVTNLVLTVVLVMLFGAFGTVVASASTWAASSFVFVAVLHRRLRLGHEGTLNAVSTMGAVTLTAGLVRWVLVATTVPETRWTALVSLCWLVPLTLTMYVGAAYVLRVFSTAQMVEVFKAICHGWGTATWPWTSLQTGKSRA